MAAANMILVFIFNLPFPDPALVLPGGKAFVKSSAKYLYAA